MKESNLEQIEQTNTYLHQLMDCDSLNNKYINDLNRKLFGNPKGGTGKFMSQEKRNKARKKRKKKSR